MATTDMNAQIHIKDGNGNVNNIFPATKIANVEGLTSALNAKADTTTVNNQLSGKVDKETGKGLSTNDYTTAEKNKLSGIEAQANKTVVDSELSSSSENPVQNKVINTALGNKADASTVSALATTVSGKADSSTVTALTSRVAQDETDISALDARIDSIVALPSGSTQGDAELMDIRVKADGTTASSAGDAVRQQISLLNSAVDDDMTLDTSDIINAFVSTNVGGHVYYSDSTKTKTIIKIVRVFAGKPYLIKVKNSNSPLNTNDRSSAIIDENGIVKQAIDGLATTAGAENTLKFTSVFDGYLCLSVDANYESVNIYGPEIYNRSHDNKENINSMYEALYTGINIDTSRIKNAYVSDTIDEPVTYSASQSSVAIINAIAVSKNHPYRIEVSQSSTPASTGNRNAVIVDENNIVKQRIQVKTTANETDVISFVAETNGFLVLTLDKNYTNVLAYGYSFFSDIIKNDNRIKLLENRCIINDSKNVPSQASVSDSNEIIFKANHTYVIIIRSSATTGGLSMGLSGTNHSANINAYEDVVKFTIGNADVLSHLWFYNSTNSDKTVEYICEEWNERSKWLLSEPGTVKVASSESTIIDKYLSEYVCDGTDDQIEIQAAIDSLPTNGGRVLLCGGRYYVTSLRDTEDSEVGYIGIEIKRPEIFHSVTIEGIGKPIRQSAYGTGLAATIHLTNQALSPYSASEHITLIGALPVDNELQREARALNLTIKNIGINTARNDMSIKCIDAEYCSALEIENVVIGVSGVVGDLPFPSPNCIGIRGLGKWNYGIYYLMKCVKISGMGVAFDLGGEHLIMEQCAVRYSDIPYRFYKYGDVTGMCHSNTLINCCEEFCAKSFVFGANPTHPNISIIDHTIEWRYDEWGRTQKAIEEHPGDICGRVNFSIDHEGYTNTSDAQFWEDGSGINMRTTNNTDLLKGDTAHRPPYPNLLQQYYDTTLNKLLTYNGTAWV